MSNDPTQQLKLISRELASNKRIAEKLVVDNVIAAITARTAETVPHAPTAIGLADLGSGFGPSTSPTTPSSPVTTSAPGVAPAPSSTSPGLEQRQQADTFLKGVESDDSGKDQEAVLIRQYLAWGLAQNKPKSEIIAHATGTSQSPQFIQKLTQYLNYIMPDDGEVFKPQDGFNAGPDVTTPNGSTPYDKVMDAHNGTIVK